MVSQTVIHKHKFNKEPTCIKFSPCGRKFAICVEHLVYIFKTPGCVNGQFNSFVMDRIFYDNHEDIIWLDWSSDSRCIVVGSKDNSLKVYGTVLMENFRPFILGGHSDEIISCSFEENSLNLNSVSRNGQLCIYKCSSTPDDLLNRIPGVISVDEPEEKRKKDDEEREDEIDPTKAIEKSMEEITLHNKNLTEKMPDSNETRDSDGKLIIKKEKDTRKDFYYNRVAKHYLLDELRKENFNVKLTAAAYHKKTKLLITAYSTGAFYLHELPAVTMIHSLNISENSIDSVCFNATGDWIALGVPGELKLQLQNLKKLNFCSLFRSRSTSRLGMAE